MKERTKIAAREMPCPACGYDLRGAMRVEGVAQCPECGTESRESTGSRIPWVHRLHRGRVRSYLQTVWLVLRRPGTLAREVNGRLSRREALGFERISRVLGALIGTALLGPAFGITPQRLPQMEVSAYWITPAFALTDSWWGLLPLAIGLYVALGLAMGCYRWILCLGANRGVIRKRTWRIGCYVSAIVPIEALLLGLAFLGARINVYKDSWEAWVNLPDWLLGWLGRWEHWIWIGCAALGLLAAGAFLWPTTVLVAKIGRMKIGRGMMLFCYPVVAAVLTAGVILAVFWVAGYAAVALWSMAR